MPPPLCLPCQRIMLAASARLRAHRQDHESRCFWHGAAEPLPGILVIHPWWGLDEEVKNTVRRLAREGYVALAVDLYSGAVATSPEKAQALMTALSADADGARCLAGVGGRP